MMATHAGRRTHVAQPHDREVDALNHAFEELGIEWRLDAAIYARHRDIADNKARVCACIEAQYPHLLKAYDRDFIGNVIGAATALTSRAATVTPAPPH